jgi:hypothetical protein
MFLYNHNHNIHVAGMTWACQSWRICRVAKTYAHHSSHTSTRYVCTYILVMCGRVNTFNHTCVRAYVCAYMLELDASPSRENLRASLKPYVDTVHVHVCNIHVWTCKYFDCMCARACVCVCVCACVRVHGCRSWMLYLVANTCVRVSNPISTRY